MSRTTINIDDPILQEIKGLQKKEGRAIGKIVSQLLAEALAQRRTPGTVQQLKWISRPMHPRNDRDFKKFDFLDVRDPFI
jgi:hypothetical protein